ncbi:MAG: glycosyltransferase family 2 protein [Sinimarinibacterium sp.]|jgi:rhamnosyltransferase
MITRPTDPTPNVHGRFQSPPAATAVASVIVTYNPPPGLNDRLRVVLRETDFAVVVDNGSDRTPDFEGLAAHDRSRIHLISNRSNVGLAAALNQGIAASAELGATMALTLDHDSTPRAGMVRKLMEARNQDECPQTIAAVVPTIAYAHPDIRCRWPKSAPGRRMRFHFAFAARLAGPTTVDLAISSGMLIHVDTWRKVGRFDEDLFIDLVDTDFCLRSRALGFHILAAPSAILDHHLGDVKKNHLLGLMPVFPTHHSALRHYYIGRNRVLLAKRHARRFPSWLIYELLGAAKLTAKVALFEPGRGQKLISMCKGTWDGMRRTPSQWKQGP